MIDREAGTAPNRCNIGGYDIGDIDEINGMARVADDANGQSAYRGISHMKDGITGIVGSNTWVAENLDGTVRTGAVGEGPGAKKFFRD